MKTVTINIITELKVWISIFIFSNILNIFSIVVYKTEWKELYTQLGFVFVISCILYLLAGAIRIIAGLFRKRV